MGQLSDDGQWWWDGAAWIPTSQVVLPNLQQTELERSGTVAAARGRLEKYGPAYIGVDNLAIALLMVPARRKGDQAMRDYRAWTLEQLGMATHYLLGPGEAMVAGEVDLLPPRSLTGSWRRDLAVSVTSAHVLVFRIDSFDGQPRSIVLAARAATVTMEVRSSVSAMFRGPGLTVRGSTGEWVIQGSPGVFNPASLLDAWRQAARAPGHGPLAGG